MVDIARKNLFHDKTRLVITVVGITFSVVLIFAQFGLYLGFMRNASIIIDNTDADFWITSKNSANFDFPLHFREAKINQVKATPGVAWAGHLIVAWANMRLHNGGAESVELIGFNPENGIGGPWRLKEGSVHALKAGPGIIVDESAFGKLGRLKVGDLVEVDDTRVRVVGITEGVKGFTTAPYVFTAYRTAQEINPRLREWTVFIIGRVAPGVKPAEVAERLRKVRDVDVWTKGQYSLRTRLYWTWQTGLGIGFLLTVLMGIVVGMVIVGQTIYNATVEHIREFGTLKAIGATNRDIYGIIVRQAVINAVLGYAVGFAITLLVVQSYGLTGLEMVVPPVLVVSIFALTVAMCLGASVVAVRKALRVDPMVVFRT
jgi:putative ABC transport system permease protein